MKSFRIIGFILIFMLLLTGCSSSHARTSNQTVKSKDEILKEMKNDIVNGKTIEKEKSVEEEFVDGELDTLEMRIQPPEGFTRIGVQEGSFAKFLRNLPLKSEGSTVHYYDGREKPAEGVYAAVVDLDVGDRDLQQCADAIMRLRSEYLWQKGEHESISFNLTNGFKVPYSDWKAGHRVIFEGNETSWILATDPSDDYQTFRDYLDFIFTYAGTLSLSRELNSKNFKDMQIGDILIQGGSPGHAVIVADMVENRETKEKRYLLIQSYMPAQDMQVLLNPKDQNGGVWYSLNETTEIQTPEWMFSVEDLKSF
ncbi:MAG: hypothetical protein N4A40_01690 [Tissierellales bacterium]|jgi:hypothetical protein|nr:hypothetical protein [Tissierellales bacterium]